ncbi:MAG: hypothetical protein FWD13_00925 [Treponema sp.]|nr:hypothetical protein [Treponema sp.]
MKKTIITVILIVSAFFIVYGQSSSSMDVVLLLDTSSGMSSSYENVNNYLTGAFLSEFLRVGDTFHLIAFSGNPRLDLARRINGIGDVETIIGRIFLQYPIESGSNIGAALSFAERYITTLPDRPKKIILVSIGASDTDNLVDASKQRLDSRNATLDFIKVTPGQPLVNLPRADRVTTSQPVQPVQPIQPVQPVQRDEPAVQHEPIIQPPQITQPTPIIIPEFLEQDDPFITSESDDSVITSETTDPESETSDISSVDSQTSDISSTTTDSTTQTTSIRQHEESEESWRPSLWVIIIFIILLLLLIALIIFLASRRSSGSRRPTRSVMDTSSSGTKDTRFVDHSKDLASFASASGSSRRTTPYDDRPGSNISSAPVINPSGPLILNLFVEDQSTAIGKRNIHSLKSGYGLSVGGSGSDDFHIFLVPMPSHLGEIRRNGSTLTFIPKKAKYFPDIGSSEVRDCINKTIRIISDKNYEMRFRFEMYEDPLITLNRMLMSVRVPG